MLSASVARQALLAIPPHVREVSAMEHSIHVPGPSARYVHMAPMRPRGGYTAARFPFRNHNLHFPSPHALLSSPHAAMPKILVKEPAPSPAASKSCISSSSSDTSSSSSLLFGGPRGARITEEVARPRRKATRGTGGRGSSRPSQGVVYAAYEIDDVPHLSDSIPNLPTYINPLKHNPAYRYVEKSFVEDDDVVMQYSLTKINNDSKPVPCYRRSGPREKIYFDPEEVRVAIVTCGGLCPGLNTVIRELVWGLWFQYGVRSIQGIDGGYRGFYSRNWIDLDPRTVEDIHKRGGTSLGTSRGGHDPAKIVSAIEDRGINQVYIIGGDGTQRGALVIYEECMRRGLKVAIAGIPKTIDNDIPIIDKSFGFDTAVEEAQRAIMAAHVEAESTHRGVGIVKLMGRYCGQISMHATLASRDVDCCLIPEVPFHLEGEGGLLRFIEHRLRENDHAVIVVAEGAGQELMERDRDLQRNRVRRDQSGNKLLNDVGLWLSNQIKDHFEEQKLEINLKYIDPTYMIRAIPANASDNIYCTLLAHSAIHGAMAGYTGFTVGPVNGRHCLIPIEKITQFTNNISLTDRMWARLLASTSQPTFLRIASSPAAASAAATALEIKANGTATASALMPAALAAPVMANSMAAVASASTATSAAASQLADLMAAADSSAWERFDGEELAGVPEEDGGSWREVDEQRSGSQT